MRSKFAKTIPEHEKEHAWVYGKLRPLSIQPDTFLSGLHQAGLNRFAPIGLWCKSWDEDDKHRRDCEIYDIFQGYCSAHRSDPESLPPWRLSRDDVSVMDRRVCSMWWPHMMDKLCRKY